jgi:NADPH2:quinone reductase
MSAVIEATALHVAAKAGGIETLDLKRLPQPMPVAKPGELVVQVLAAAINPSDVKATLGIMPHAVFPRTPGRDFAGQVVAGPSALIGQLVWGSGGDLGITRNGSHARYLVLPEQAARRAPQGISVQEAGAVGVPFVTAIEGFRRAGGVQAGQTVVVFGANGKVGQAAVQLAARAGAEVIAVQRQDAMEGFACQAVDIVNAGAVDPTVRIMELTGGKGADIVFNTVDRVYWEAAHAVMSKGSSQIFIIATKAETVPFDLFRFYRGMHSFYGIDTLALDCVRSCELLDGVRSGFEDGSLKPFPVLPSNVLDLSQAMAGYRRVLAGAAERIVLTP